MAMKKNLQSNFKIAILNQIFAMLIPLLTTPYISRVLGSVGVGINAYLFSIVSLFSLFTILSIPLYGVRQIAKCQNKDEKSKTFLSIYAFQFVMALVGLCAFVIFIVFFNQHQILLLIFIFHLLASMFDVTWFFNGTEQIGKIAIRNFIIKIITVSSIFLFVRNEGSLPVFILINVMTTLVGQVVMWVPLRKEIDFKKIRANDVKIHIRPILILFVPHIATQIYILLNRIVLGSVSGEAQVGFYQQANMITEMILGILTSLSVVLLPRVTSEFSQGRVDNFKKIIREMLHLVLIISIPMTFGLIAISSNFVHWFFGDEFAPVVPLLVIIAPKIVFINIASILGIQILIATDQQMKYLVSVSIAAIASLIINAVLVSSYAAIATALALMLAEAIGVVIQVVYTKKYIGFGFFIKCLVKYTLIGSVMFVSILAATNFLTLSNLFLTLVQIAIGLTVYGLILVFVKDEFLYKILGALKPK